MATSTQLGSATLGAGGATALTGAGTFTDLCDILENQGTDDGIAGLTDNWQTIETDVPCSIKAMAPLTERNEADEIRAVGVYEIMLPTDTIIDPADRIVCNGVTYEVRQRDPKISNQIAIMVRAVRIN